MSKITLVDQASMATPTTPASGRSMLYTADDQTVRAVFDDGTVKDLTASGSGDVAGPAGAVADNLVAFNGTTGKLIKDSGTALGNVPSAIPVPVADGGTGSTTTPAALVALGAAPVATTKPYLDTGLVPTTIYVDAATGDDDNDGTIGNPLLTLGKAELLIASAPTVTRTIKLVGSGTAATPNVYSPGGLIIQGLNFVTIESDELETIDTRTIDSVTSATKAAGLVLTDVGAAMTIDEHRGRLLRYTSGGQSGKFGVIYANTSQSVSVTQETQGTTFLAPVATDTYEILDWTAEIQFPLGAGYILESLGGSGFKQVRFSGANKFLFCNDTDKLDFQRCRFEIEGLLAGRGGSLFLKTCSVANRGSTFSDWGMLTSITQGLILLKQGTLIDGVNAPAANRQFIAGLTEGFFETYGEVVFRELTGDGVLIRGSGIVTLSSRLGGIFSLWRYIDCTVAVTANSDAEGWGWAPIDLPELHSNVALTGPYTIEAEGGARVRVGAGSTITDATGTVSVSADGGSTNIAQADDLTYIEGGSPAATGYLGIGAAAGGDLGGTYPNPTVDNGADGTAIHDDTAGEIAAIALKAVPVSADVLIIEDSGAANAKKRITVGSLPTGGGGEANTASNVNVGGVGVFKQKSGVDLEFRGVNAASSKLTVVLDAANNEIDIDAADATDSQAGAIELATQGEVDTGTDTSRAIVPATLAGSVLAADVATNNAKISNANHTGDVTGATVLTIAADAVTNAMLADVATSTIKGRITALTGDPEDLSGTQATTLLDSFTSALQGVVPGSGGGTANFLRADGTWAAPPGGGTDELVGVSVNDTTPGYLLGKLTTATTGVAWAEINDGGDEDLRLDVDSATAGGPGLIELATQGEVDTGTDTTRAIVPATLAGSTLASDVTANNAKVSNATHTGDVTGATALTIAANAVTLAKMATLATARFLGRVTAGVGDPEAMTGTQATTLMDQFTSALKGLVPASGGGTANFLRADGTFAVPPGGGITGPGSSVDRGRVVWDGTGGIVIDDTGLRDYGASATDPVSPAPADGDTYRNTALDMQMYYDGTRAKWLGDSVQIAFGRAGNVGSGAYYRGTDRRSFSATNGRDARHNGTVVAIEYTRNDTDAAAFEATAAGSTIATLASSATSGSDFTLDGDFSAGQVLGARNQTGGNTTSQTMGWITIRWRA